MLSLNEIISCFLMQSNTITQDEANTYLIDLSNEEDFYLNCLNIFYSEESTISTKFFAIQVLKNTIQKRWVCMRPSFQDEVRSFIIFYFFDNPFHKETPIDTLVFQIILSILFFEWPNDWQSFFADLFNIENSEITIILSLKLLSFIGYEAQSNNITSVGTFIISSALENKMHNIFLFIQDLIFKNTVSKEIVDASFSFLTVCIPWIPTNLFIESLFFSQLAENFFDNSELAESIIPFLTELITSLDLPPDKQGIISQIFNILMNINGKNTNTLLFVSAIKTCYNFYAQIVELPDNAAQYKEALDLIMKITIEADDFENPELLETCLSFWVDICQRIAVENSPVTENLYLPLTYSILEILHAKIPPPFIMVTHIDELDVEHSTIENSQYHSNIYSYIKQSLTFLININENSVIDFFYEKFGELQSNAEKEGFDETNSNENDISDEIYCSISQLTWMIYSSAGSFSETAEEERLFDLIDLLIEFTRDLRPNITISAIMAVFQYPHFMQQFQEKLNFLTQKIFELVYNFPRETDFLAVYILKTCSSQIRQLIIQQDLFNYLISISDTLKEKLCDDCLIDIYSVFGIFIKEISDNKQKEDILPMILQLPTIATASDINLNRELHLCLKCHIALQNKIAFDYIDFLKEINFAQLFQFYSNELFQQFQSKEKNPDLMSSLYLVKSNIVILITQFVTFCLEPTFVNDFIVPSFLNLFLTDYNESPNELKVFHTIKFAQSILQRSDVPVGLLYESILPATFSMISQNFDDYPEFRLPFYSFISSIIHRNFAFLMELKMADLDELIQILIYGCNHQLLSISQLSINMLSEFITNLKGQPRFEEIFSQYCIELVRVAISILSDLSFKSIFEEIAVLIKSIFSFQDEIAIFGPEIVEVLVPILPMANPSDLIELVKSLTECGPYLEGIRILLKDFIIGLGKVMALERETFPIDEANLSALIRESFSDNQGEFADEFVTDDQFSDEIRHMPFDHH